MDWTTVNKKRRKNRKNSYIYISEYKNIKGRDLSGILVKKSYLNTNNTTIPAVTLIVPNNEKKTVSKAFLE
jgi:hypothetical protein